MSLDLLTSKQIVVDSSQQSAWVLDQGRIQEIPSLEATGNSLTQDTDALQPDIVDGFIKSPLSKDATMVAPSTVVDINGENFISFRFRLDSFTEGDLGDIFETRSDSAGVLRIIYSTPDGVPQVDITTRGRTFNREITVGEWNTVTWSNRPATDGINDREISLLFNDEQVITKDVSLETPADGTVYAFGDAGTSTTDFSFSHLVISKEYPTDADFITLHNFVKNEFTGDLLSGTVTYNAAPVEGATVDLISVDQAGGGETVAETGLTTQADGTVTSSVSRDGAKEYYFRVYPFNLPISGLTGTLTATDATNLDLGVDLSALDTGQNRAYTIKATGGTGSGEVILIKGYTDKANGLVTVDYHPFGNDTTFEVCRLISGENASLLPRTS